LAAINDPLYQANQMVSDDISQLTGGVKIPGII